MSSENATATATETKTLEQQIDQLVAQFKSDLMAQVHLLLLNQVKSTKVETKEKTLTNPVVASNGTKRWYNAQGQLHRDELDEYGEVLPALEQERVNGYKEWRINGQVHREGDKPAIICSNGDQLWYINNQLHRADDRPAIISSNGHQEWYINNQLHRVDDKPAIIRANGDQLWYINNQLHREGDKPAIERSDGEKEWWIEGKCVKKLLFKTA